MKKAFLKFVSIIFSIFFISGIFSSCLAVNEEKAVAAINRIGDRVGAMELNNIRKFMLIKKVYDELINLILQYKIHNMIGVCVYVNVTNPVLRINVSLLEEIGVGFDLSAEYTLDRIIELMQNKLVNIILTSLKKSGVDSVREDAQILIDAIKEN
jgi:hypothetical protein